MAVNVACHVCGTLFSIPLSRFRNTKRHFCSEKCRKTPCVPCTCAFCGEEFLVLARGARDAHYCSNDCRNARARRDQIHKKTPRVTNTCLNCGKSFEVRRSMAKQPYCSKRCSYEHTAHKHRGENNPKWKPKVKLICEYCGKEFETYQCRTKDNRRKYCCKEHFAIGNMQRLASGQRTDIERAMAQCLTSACIAYQEQVVMFNKFMVDFLLKDYPIVVQCDGRYWHNRPKVQTRDKGQDRYLAKAGYRVLRFTDDVILHQLDSCLVAIERAIAEVLAQSSSGNMDGRAEAPPAASRSAQ